MYREGKLIYSNYWPMDREEELLPTLQWMVSYIDSEPSLDDDGHYQLLCEELTTMQCSVLAEPHPLKTLQTIDAGPFR